MIGTRTRLTYFDQNDAFGRALPPDGVVGTVTRRLGLEDWGDDWYLIELDEPFEYGGREHDRVLIRSRWQGYQVGEREPTSVFVLLIPDPQALDKPRPRSTDFEHAAWGMAQTLAVA